ncbi:hypothetical protein Kpol_339p15 [Vanderwaltozyma polyspora DSM 70294]|uniref:PH domain-containing protein n=1 Tax=Vanderwaltozyma polyspora (strain ATCC 22028 / DSM 70294 / BCRC 21397 / CBS 2163 / NBRC 10782 / NRRL Y-8283 / UCD 57-17) TaxID=436907 RepID=A7TSE3_VANPO|nr:uncharacterized protein Kpol_339p15 [Vanderwaltozyma polyspora DSM 70294]EDO14828.1 hypothetical protein Kpol_339p15 [Vanderwaltozyma polyspora DSM 70294]
METLDVQSRSFVVRWVKCASGDTVDYQVKPLKKSIELGIYKRLKNSVDAQSVSVHIAPDTQALLDYTTKALLSRSTTSSYNNVTNQENRVSLDVTDSQLLKKRSNTHSSDVKKNDKPHRSLSLTHIQQQSKEIPLRDKLAAAGFSLVEWVGHVSGNELTQGTLEVKDDDYYYAFILDNTASKNVKKRILFNASVRHSADYKPKEVIRINSSASRISKPRLSSASSSSKENLDVLTVGQGRYLQGYLYKKRRKKLQGFKKRFFSLDFKYGTLSYYVNEQNQTCRGEIVISLSTVSANKKDKLIIIDSGMEIWALKASSVTLWQKWVDALQSCFDETEVNEKEETIDESLTPNNSNGRKSQRRSSKMMSYLSTTQGPYIPLPQEKYSEFTATLKLIKQKLENCKIESKSYVPISDPTSSTALSRTSSLSSQGEEVKHGNFNYSNSNMQSMDSLATDYGGNSPIELSKPNYHQLYQHLSDLELFLDQFVSQSFVLQRDHQCVSRQATENRISSISGFSDDEYFDAEELTTQGVILIPDEAVDGDQMLAELEENHDKYIDDVYEKVLKTIDDETTLEYISNPDDTFEDITEDFNDNILYPLPQINSLVKRRNDVKPSNSEPVGLLSFLRKNVGKDLSSISMPVSSNEPISILQLISESFEYADLLKRISDSDSVLQPLSVISSFAVSMLSIYRDKTRALRKPFNPLLGETFEFVSDKMEFRLVAEKVCHKPQIFAFHAEHSDWECSYTVSPTQKFWGKSIELNNDGIMQLRIKNMNEVFEWSQPTTMLKNLIAGERYMEPIDEFKVTSSNGGYSRVIFTSAGMFGGRSENLAVNVSPSRSSSYKKVTLSGKWTESIKDKNSNKVIWKVNELVSNPKKKYGFTKFTANLNEITSIEKGNIPPTDSRLRPDIRAYENGEIDKAEKLKLELEQMQRDRRNEGKDVKPQYFKKVSDNKWEFIRGKNGYWDRRKRHDWSNVVPLW